jgi:glycosyltransferase involved in cell wall biosynthesis
MTAPAHRVLHVIHYPFFGGPQNQVLALSRPLESRGWESVVVLPDDPGSALSRLLAGDVNAQVMRLGRMRAQLSPLRQLRYLAGLPGDVSRLRCVMRRVRIDLVVSTSIVNLQGQVAGRLENLPVITQLLDSRTPMLLRRAVMPLVTSLSDVLMPTGMGIAEVHPGAVAIGNRLIPFYPPVETSVFRPDAASRTAARDRLGIPADAFVAGAVANVTPQKGLEWFARATGELSRRHSDVHVVLLSGLMNTQTEYARKIEGEFADQGLLGSPRFHWMDGGADIANLIAALDVFLLTSVPRSEGVSTTVLEAMSTGIPVVTADVGALREVVRHGASGFVVPPMNVDAIVDATERLRADIALRARMGADARRLAVDLYDVETCADTYVQAFEVAIDHSSRRRVGSRR